MAEENYGVNFAPINSCIRHMDDALVEEMIGYTVDLLPDGCKLIESEDISGLWIGYYPELYDKASIAFFFYLNDEDELVYVGAEQDGHSYFLTTDESGTLEEVWAWYELNLEFSNGEETESEAEGEGNSNHATGRA